MSWGDVDLWRAQHTARPRGHEKLGHENRVRAEHHLTKLDMPYRVKLVKGEVRQMAPEHLSRLGAATRRRVEVLTLCGTLLARVYGQPYHRITNGLLRVTCDACLVALDGEIEAGRAHVNDAKTVVFKAE